MAGQRRPSSAYPDGQDPIEQHIALRLRQFRYQRSLTQTQLGAALGVSFQQIQKYEHGSDKISSSSLYRAAHTLGVPFCAFFDGFDDQAPLPPVVDRDAEKLGAAVNRIPNLAVRDAVLGLIEALKSRETHES